ncbi:MAG: hypothetical protein U1F58_06520 [Burkholderiales bacterium]
MNPSRRTFIAAGLVGAAALATAAWLRSPHGPAVAAPRRALDADAEAIMGAVIPVLLDGALPDEPGMRARAIADTLAAVDTAVAGLPRAAQKEVGELFALLALPPVRLALARVSPSWTDAPAADVRGFLDRFRDSPWKLQRAAYAALHELVLAAWYAMPRAWPAIGYPGPPPP